MTLYLCEGCGAKRALPTDDNPITPCAECGSTTILVSREKHDHAIEEATVDPSHPLALQEGKAA